MDPVTEVLSTPEQLGAQSVPARGRNKKLVIACIIVAAFCGTWAFWPLTQPPSTSPENSAPSTMIASADKLRPLDLAAFQAPLWVAPIPPPAPPPPPPPLPPLKLQLIAITSAEPGVGSTASGFGALIFDPDQNKLYSVFVGQSIGERTIIRITESAVEFKDSSGTRQLSLKSDRTTERATPAGIPKEPGEVNP